MKRLFPKLWVLFLIVEASIFDIGKNYSKEVDVFSKIKFNSPDWIDMYQWALKKKKM